MQKGKLNIIFGWIWLLAALLVGAYLQTKHGAGPEWLKSSRKVFWGVFHAHASLLALVNILYGYCFERVNLGNRLKTAGSLLLIAGTILFSGAFFLAGFSQGFIKLARPGTLCVIASIGILISGLIRQPQ
ncbi:MAG: hypothetical protein NG737_06210 [Omnitrophica bacterium]|nr:hypothetical protein [Candidatus Omnitrophota bacterium]